MKVYVIFVAVLCGVGLTHAKSISRRAGYDCTSPPEPEDKYGSGCGIHYIYCNDIQYFYSKDQEKCEKCMFCPKGQEPDNPDSCSAQGTGIEVKCDACRSDHYSNSESQSRCFPCSRCLDKVTVTECTATTDTVCGGCKPGYYEDGGYCSKCGDHLSNKQKEAKGCTLPVTSTLKPTTTEETTTPIQQTSKLPSAPKQTNISIANIRRTTTASTPKSDPSSDKEVVDIHLKHQTGQIGIIALGVVIVLVAVIIGVCRIVKTCTKTCYSSGMGKSYQSSFSSSNTRTTRTDSDAQDANGDSSLSSSTSSVNVITKQDEPAEHNFDVNVSKNKFPGKGLVLQTERVEVQQSPNEEKQKQTKPKSAPPGKPSDIPLFTRYQNAAINNLNHDKVVMNSENPQPKKKKRSLSVPVIITPNQLESFRNNAKGENSPNRLSNVSSDDSDQGQEEEDTLLKQPSTSTMLTIPLGRNFKGRRKSVTIFPLSLSGGKFSSGSAGKDFAVDSMGTTSMNNPSMRLSSRGSLTSHPSNAVKEKKHAKLKKQHSHDNGVMEKLDVDTDEVFEATPLLEENMSLKGPVTQPQEQGGYGERVLMTYQPLPQQYGELFPLVSNQGQEGVAKCNNPSSGSSQGYRTLYSGASAPQIPEPIAKCDIPAFKAPSTLDSRISSSPSAGRPSRTNPSIPSPSGQPGGYGSSSGLPAGHGPKINDDRCGNHSQSGGCTHIHYNGPVIHAEGGTNVQFALGNNSNQIQQGASGAGCSNTRQPPTPEGTGVPCSDDSRATFPSYEDSLA